jgi:hypothetical protein
MEIWNREELYAEVWEQPLLKIAPKYGISAVALGKVCQKLQIPLPGRGYWVKKEFGKPVEHLPLTGEKLACRAARQVSIARGGRGSGPEGSRGNTI